MDGLCNFLNSEEYYRVPKDIKLRLAKLTLSKKKELRQSLEKSLMGIEEKSESTARKSLILQLLTDDSSESEADEINKLFRSKSFRYSDKCNKKPQQYDPDETHCSLLENIQKNENQIVDNVQMNITEDMEPLQFSQEKTEKAISEISMDKLSQKISNLEIYSPIKSDIAIEKTHLVSLEKTQIISVESERKSSGRVDVSSDFPPLRIETEGISKHEIFEESETDTYVILKPKIEKPFNTTNKSILSLSSDNSDKDSNCSSDSESSDEEEVIVVSDSDEADDCPILDKNSEKDPIGGPPKKSDSSDNYSDQVSEIRRSGHTLLANTLSNERADRLEAFLRDLPAIGEENYFYSDNEDIQNSLNMESNNENIQTSQFNKSIDNNVQNSILIKSTDESNISNSIPEESIEIAETSAESLSKKKTSIAEGVSSSYEQESKQNQNYQENSQTKLYQNDDVPTVEDNSPLIQETCSNKNDKSNCSTQSNTKNSSSDSSYEYEQISISAKFNIKIHIDSQPNIVINHNVNHNESYRANSANNESPSTQESRPSEIYQENLKAITQPSILETLPEKCNTNASVENVDEKAKQILTKLYGNQWQTPENIKKLDKTIISTSKNNSANISKNILKSMKIEPEGSEEKSTNESNIENTVNKENSLSDKNPLAVQGKDKKNSTTDNVKIKMINKSPLELTKQFQNLHVNLENTTYDDPSIVDFSIFHKNIRNDLDSTRLPGNIPPFKSNANQNHKFKVPLTERRAEKIIKKYPTMHQPQTEKPLIKSTRSGRKVKPINWKQLIKNDNSSSDNDICSDDSEADATYRDRKQSSSSSQCSDGSYTKHSPSRTKKTLPKKKKCSKNNKFQKNDDKLVYLDLSDEVVKVQDECKTPPAEHDPSFNERLNNILKSCTFQPKKQIEATPSSTTSKRRLFTPRFGDEDELLPPDSPSRKLQDDSQEIKLTLPLPSIFGMPINKKLESVKNGTPIFKIPTPSKSKTNETPKTSKETKENKTPRTPKTPKTPKSQNIRTDLIEIEIPEYTPTNKYGFLKSLDVMVSKSRCHPDALIYRENYKNRKEELAQRLYKLYNEKVFKSELEVKISWNKKLIKTAGRCSNKRKGNLRSSVVELSEKVLTSADRLRCTLIHELCHAATWIFNGEHGHGATWKTWAQKANFIFQELPKIGVCHSYDIEYKYTYKCIVCQAKSNAHSKSKKVENIRCAYCHGAIEIFLNKKDEEGNVIATPIKEPTGFAKFVKENYKNFQKPDLKHGDIMKILSNEFSALKVGEK